MIQGEHLFLRQVCETDVNDAYHGWLNDPEVNQYLEVRHAPVSKQEILDYVSALKEREDVFFMAICMQSDRRHIGNIKIGPVHPIHRFAEISIVIGDKTCWGRGLGSQALKLAAEFAFTMAGVHKLFAGLYENNTGSYKAFLQAGFQKEGVFCQMRLHQGRYVDQIMMGRVKGELS